MIDDIGPKIRAGSVVIEEQNGTVMQNNMFTLLNSTNRSPYKKELGGS